MQAVIVRAKRQAKEVDKLVKHCKKLDETRVLVIDACDKVTSYPERNNHALHQAFGVMKDKPFVWLEPDSIPIKKGWMRELEAEYIKLKKPIMLSSDSNPPHDLVGGIGVYGGIARRLIPVGIEKIGWDGWLIKHIKPLVSFTSLIQHSYGDYSRGCQPHMFPRDNRMIRSNSVIFHRDKFQGLIV